MEYIYLLLIVGFSYLFGSIPSAVIISKRFFGFDIRAKGSGNMGSTNAFRILGVKWGIITQLADMIKGTIPVLLVSKIFADGLNFGAFSIDTIVLMLISAIVAILGHIFSVFVDFRGGKGVNTAFGVLVAIAPIDMGVAVVTFLLFVGLSGYVSLGSITGAISFPTSIFIRQNYLNSDIADYNILIYFALLTAFMLVFAHRSNVVRLLKGKESKFEKLQVIKFGKNKKDKS
jgi:acyl phosphate:glycerol-3-phosphate acyltransferase